MTRKEFDMEIQKEKIEFELLIAAKTLESLKTGKSFRRWLEKAVFEETIVYKKIAFEQSQAAIAYSSTQTHL